MSKKPKSAKTGMYGMWSRAQKRFIFGIQEPSKNKAIRALREEIGHFNRYHFYAKEIVEGHSIFVRNGLGKELKAVEVDE